MITPGMKIHHSVAQLVLAWEDPKNLLAREGVSRRRVQRERGREDGSIWSDVPSPFTANGIE